jgi:dipeptidyl aminopeptidase/acylaminoacyl peptidase
VYVARALGGSPRRLTTHEADDASAQWSRDGQWIYFASNRTGRHEIWKRRADGSGEEIKVTGNGGWVCEESTDANLLYYMKIDAPGFWQMPVKGGEERQVFDLPITSNWAVRQNGIYYLSLPDKAVYLYEFAARRARRLTGLPTLRSSPTNGFSLSPDAQHALYANTDRVAADIMLAENFR